MVLRGQDKPIVRFDIQQAKRYLSRLQRRGEYLARRKLIRQCEILKLELTKGECLLLEKRIGMKRDAVPKNEDVVALVTVKRKWREIERNAIEALFESVDIPELLKNGREACGFSRAEASAFFHISQRTLKNYEEGKRLSKADVLLKPFLYMAMTKFSKEIIPCAF